MSATAVRQKITDFRIAPACLCRGIERSMLEGETDASRINVLEASDQSNVDARCPVMRDVRPRDGLGAENRLSK